MRTATGLTLAALAISLASPAVAAQGEQARALAERADSLTLSEDPYWRALLYYTPARTVSGWRSEVTDPAFFNSPRGRVDPAAELEATLHAFFAPEPDDTADQHPQCKFIARYAWLRGRLGFDDGTLPPRPCTRYREWIEAIDPASVALVFAADHVGNPSSAFGHNLLRFDRPDETGSRLVSYAVNFAAAAGDDNPVIYAYRGLTGGYSGYFSLLPYYEKVREYNDLERRDMWEYELALSDDEIRRMMMHLWETGSASFDYYFLHENCSYRLLGLLEIARPGLELSERFRHWAIPTDTVRVVLEQAGLLRAVTWRPSTERRLKHSIARASRPVRDAALKASAGETYETPDLTPAERAHALELAHDHLHYHFLDGSVPRETAAPRLRELLVERSGVDARASTPEPVVPATRPDQGHATRRLGAGFGDGDTGVFTEIHWRGAYHDLADPSPGYRHGTGIEMFDIALRHEHDSGRIRLEHLKVVEIWSLAPRDAFLRPVSWKVGAGLMRDPLPGPGRPLAAEFHGGGGLAYALDRDERWIVYGLLEAQLLGSRRAADRVRLGAGPRIGVVFGGSRTALHASAVARRYAGVSATRVEWRLEQSVTIGTATALRLSVNHAREGGRDHDEHALMIHRFF